MLVPPSVKKERINKKSVFIGRTFLKKCFKQIYTTKAFYEKWI